MKQMRIFLCLMAAAMLGFGIKSLLWQEAAVFQPSRIPDTVLVIDAGHGGEDGGAVGVTGVIESHINLAVAQKLHSIMDLYGIRSVLLRDKDISLHDADCNTLREKKVSDLHHRVAVVNSISNAVLISIHQNTFPNPKYHGAQVFFGQNEASITLAQQIQNALNTALDPSNKRTPTQITETVYLMKHIDCPAVLIECGFLSNPEEEQRLATDRYQTQLAMTIASAYITYR